MATQIVEINGIKFEIDMDTAKQIRRYKVGDNVKLLIKEYGDNYKSFPGVIVGFDNFQTKPNIRVCYVEHSYSEVKTKFIDINSSTKEVEMVHMSEYEVELDKQKVIDLLDKEVEKQKKTLEETIAKKDFFLKNYLNELQVKTNVNV